MRPRRRRGWAIKARILAGFAIFAVGVAVFGCGGASEEDQVKEAVTGYFDGLSRGDGNAACENLSGAGTRELIAGIVRNVPELGVPSCPEAVETLAGYMGSDEKQVLADAKVTAVQIDGERATAQVEGATSEVKLVQSGDGWLIDGGFGP